MMFRIFLILGLLFSSQAIAAKTVSSLPSVFANVGVVAQVEVLHVIKEELIDNDLVENLKIDIRGFDAGFSLKEKRDKYEVSIESIDLQKKSRRFKARVSFSADDFYEAVDVNGRYTEMVSVPVLSSRIAHDTVIQAENIEYMYVEKHRMRGGTIDDESDLIGHVLKHSMRPMRAVRKRDVVREQIMSRNSVVSLVYKTPFLTLRSTGVVMDSGAKGDVIRVRNNTSNKIIQAVIEDSNSVLVSQESL